MTEKRNPGLDLCRIGGMFGIVILHILGNGGVLNQVSSNTISYGIVWGMEIAAYCSVNLFALLSGYLSCEKKKYSSYRLIELLSSLIFYSTLITLAFIFVRRSVFTGVGTIAFALIPMLAGHYWYITCYVIVFLLLPYLNLLLNKLSKEALVKLSMLLFVLLSVIPGIADIDFFQTADGYSAAWLVVCYIWGAAYRKTEKTIFRHYEWLAFCISVAIVLLIRVFGIHSPFGSKEGYMMKYTSPLIVLNAIMLLQLGAGFKRQLSEKMAGIFAVLSGVAFDVYLLHCHILIYDYVIKDHFVWIADLNPLIIPVAVVIVATGIYAIGSICGAVRMKIFRIKRIEKMILFLSKITDSFCGGELQTGEK